MTVIPGLANALQKAIKVILTSDDNINRAVKGRINDRVPAPVVFPYITIGDDDIRDDSNTCFTGSVSVLTSVHVWSRAVGKTEAKSIGDMVRRALNTEISIEGHEAVAGGFLTEVYRTTSDGLTNEGVLVFEYLIDPT